MKISKTSFLQRSAGVLPGALATVVASLAPSLGSVAHAEYDLKGYSPSQCRNYGYFTNPGVYFYHTGVQNTSSNYAMVVCPALMDSESNYPRFGANIYFRKATATPAFYCYVFSVDMASATTRWLYNADSTNVGVRGLYNSSVPSFRYGSNSVICGLPPGSELLNYYAGES